MLDATIRVLLEKKFGKPIRYPKDCEALAAIICEVTGYQVSSSTLKRVLGFYKEVESPRLYTLDTIAIFLGFRDWADAQSQLNNSNPTSHFLNNEFQSLGPGNRIKITYPPDRELILKSNGHDHFEVVSSNSDQLLVGDLVEVAALLVNQPLICSKVIRNNINVGQYIGARKGGIQSIAHYVGDDTANL
jgi:hypothetical protein